MTDIKVTDKVIDKYVFYWIYDAPIDEIRKFGFEIFDSKSDVINHFHENLVKELYDSDVISTHFGKTCMLELKCCISNQSRDGDKYYFGVQKYINNFKIEMGPNDLAKYPS